NKHHTFIALVVLDCGCYYLLIIFFFSSRRRHTRCYRDWSSDVCSSDLRVFLNSSSSRHKTSKKARARSSSCSLITRACPSKYNRSEERRVGKECRYRWATYR